MPIEKFDSDGYFVGYKDRVREAWIDYNQHMNVAYYVVAFDAASDCFLQEVGINESYVKVQMKSAFVVDMNVTYRQELKLGAPIMVKTYLLEVTSKKIRMFHEMYHAEEGFLAATNEILAVHVDMNIRKSSDFPANIRTNLDQMHQRQSHITPAKNVGRVLSV